MLPRIEIITKTHIQLDKSFAKSPNGRYIHCNNHQPLAEYWPKQQINYHFVPRRNISQSYIHTVRIAVWMFQFHSEIFNTVTRPSIRPFGRRNEGVNPREWPTVGVFLAVFGPKSCYVWRCERSPLPDCNYSTLLCPAGCLFVRLSLYSLYMQMQRQYLQPALAVCLHSFVSHFTLL